MKIEKLEVLEVKVSDDGKEILIRVAPAIPVKIVSLVFANGTSSSELNELARSLTSMKLNGVTVATA